MRHNLRIKFPCKILVRRKCGTRSVPMMLSWIVWTAQVHSNPSTDCSSLIGPQWRWPTWTPCLIGCLRIPKMNMGFDDSLPPSTIGNESFQFTKRVLFQDPLVNDDQLLYFADVCGGPGGFSEYTLWRKRWLAKGFGITLKCQEDYQPARFISPIETFEPYYGNCLSKCNCLRARL